jgi:hypothetical protein
MLGRIPRFGIMIGMTKHKPAEYFGRPETFATSLLLLILDHYGTEALGWDNATLQLE